MRCNIVIVKYYNEEGPDYKREELYRIPGCGVPEGDYRTGEGHPRYELDAARITIHEFAWTFFDPEKKKLDKFEGTDAFRGTKDILVYLTKAVPPDEIEALVTALAEEFVPETADAR